jgi:hypothetical protein
VPGRVSVSEVLLVPRVRIWIEPDWFVEPSTTFTVPVAEESEGTVAAIAVTDCWTIVTACVFR